MHLAAEAGHLKMLLYLLDHKGNVNKCNPSNGATALHLAVQKGHVEAVKLLLSRGADKQARMKDGQMLQQLGLNHPAVLELLRF